jgi:hypothetical protein
MTPNGVNCQTVTLGTGLPDCVVREGLPNGFIRVRKGWKVPVSTVIDKDFVIEQIQNGVFKPFLGAVLFTDNTPEDTIQEFEDGTKVVVRDGKPEFAFRYEKGYAFNKIAYSYNAFKGGDLLLTFASGAIAGAVSVDGTQFTGLDMGMLNTATYKFQTGAETSAVNVGFQLLNAKQFNTRMAILSQEALGFDVNNEINGIIDCVLTGSTTIEKATINVKTLANPLFFVEGLINSNFRVTDIVGDPIPFTLFVLDDGNYVVNYTTDIEVGDVVLIELYDATNSVNVAISDPYLYKGSIELTA